jgi:hypothetical protein
MPFRGDRSGRLCARDDWLVCTKGGYVALDGEPPASREAYEEWLEKELFAAGDSAPDDLVRWWSFPSRRRFCATARAEPKNLGLHTIDVTTCTIPKSSLLVLDRPTFLAKMRARSRCSKSAPRAARLQGMGVRRGWGFRVPPEHKQHLTLAETGGRLRAKWAGTTHHFPCVQLPVSLAMPRAARLPTQPLGRKLVPLLEAADALGFGRWCSDALSRGGCRLDCRGDDRAVSRRARRTPSARCGCVVASWVWLRCSQEAERRARAGELGAWS